MSACFFRRVKKRRPTPFLPTCWLLTILISCSQVDTPAIPADWTMHTIADGVYVWSPSDWELGEPGLGGSIWVALAPFRSEGNIVVRTQPQETEPDFTQETTDSFRQDFLSAAGIAYSDIEIKEFDNRTRVSGSSALYLTYTGTSIANTTVDGMFLITWHRGIMYTVHAEYRSLASDEQDLVARVARTLTFD